MKKDFLKKILKWGFILALLFLLILLIVNFYVYMKTKKQILKEADYLKLKDIDCALVLGAAVWGDHPSPMLKDRLDTAISLYQQGIVPKIIMSGNGSKNDGNEVIIMKQYAIDKGVPSTDIFMDYAGFSTYDSVVRAKKIFQAKKIVIVTQEYHLYRSLYIADQFDLEAYGVKATPVKYRNQLNREVREILARDKDVFKCIFKFSPKYLGEAIPIVGDGDRTNQSYSFKN